MRILKITELAKDLLEEKILEETRRINALRVVPEENFKGDFY